MIHGKHEAHKFDEDLPRSRGGVSPGVGYDRGEPCAPLICPFTVCSKETSAPSGPQLARSLGGSEEGLFSAEELDRGYLLIINQNLRLGEVDSWISN
jgi:hypothetical protein